MIQQINLESAYNTNLFDDRNTLPGIGSYQYRAILINKNTYIRFSITIKSKNGIYEENKIVFNENWDIYKQENGVFLVR